MFAPVEFYKAFLLDFFILKSATYKNVLDNLDLLEAQVLKDVTDYSREDYRKTLKGSIRFTYFHSIETLFEIIFAIERGIRYVSEENQDQLILHRLSKSEFSKNFERIRLIGQRSDVEQSKLWDKIYFKSVDREIPILQYIFYYLLDAKNSDITPEEWRLLGPSLETISNTLSVLAKDFSDRDEYNAYKHGLRIIPLASRFALFESQNRDAIKDMDFSDSMTFVKEVDNEIRFITKAFDTERDFKMTAIASQFIENIISIRRGVYFDTKAFVRFFQKDLVEEITKTNVPARELTVTLKFDKPPRAFTND